MYTGRTNDLARRGLEHGRDQRFNGYNYNPVFRTNDYGTQRGLEQRLYEEAAPPLNRIRPISPTNPKREEYMNKANNHLGGG